ncbi:MAG: hypothetical protein ACLP5H_19555 [Desulfomonilaceae bacterium]
MEISYLSASIIFIATFVVFAYLAFRTARSVKTEGGSDSGGSGARHASLCYECLGAANLDEHRMAECSSACSLPPA